MRVPSGIVATGVPLVLAVGLRFNGVLPRA